MLNKRNPVWWYLAALLVANLALLLPNPLNTAAALLLICLLPGLSWSHRFFGDTPPLIQFIIAAGISYSATALATLLLHYLPGPIFTWQLLAILNIFALLPLIKIKLHPDRPISHLPRYMLIVLAVLLLIALSLRAINLGYSEFQGDEALAMITAAEALEGHQDALFLRSKGPAEVLLPMAVWRLTGTITETDARLPFTIASLLAIITIFCIGRQVGGTRVGWLAAAFFAFNGFMVAFGRIVQYQAFVVWFSALAFLMVTHWQVDKRYRFALLSGLFLGTGLLAHYDAILALPAIIWLFVPRQGLGVRGWDSGVGSSEFRVQSSELGTQDETHNTHSRLSFLLHILSFGAAFLLTTALFYLPFALDPQANRTGDYVGGRIGNELRNNLPNFFHFNTFYSSFFYIVITALLVLFFLMWILWRTGTGAKIVSVLAAIGIVVVIFQPTLLTVDTLNQDLSFLPFALLFAAAFLALFAKTFRGDTPFRLSQWQAIIVWLAIPFLGYNFVVALGLTHIYTTVPAWSLLAALGWNHLPITNYQLPIGKFRVSISNALLALFLLLSTVFLWNAFVRHDVEYWQDYPNGNLAFFWTPYDEPPQAGFFGFAHRAGWKAVGQKIATGELAGDYGSNEEPDVTTWYTRGAPRACDPQPEFYFIANDLIDPVDVPQDVLESGYQQVGAVTLPNQKQMQIMQQTPTTLQLDSFNDAMLSAQFDDSATPAAFARSARGALPAEANFGNLVQLIGYDIDTRRAYPGGRLPVTLYWQVLAPIEASYQVFTHLESGSGPVAQSDGVPVCWTYPTDVWRPGQIIADQHAIPLSPEITPGQYPLEIGLYLPDIFKRLDVLDVAGNPAGTSLTLSSVEIKRLGD